MSKSLEKLNILTTKYLDAAAANSCERFIDVIDWVLLFVLISLFGHAEKSELTGEQATYTRESTLFECVCVCVCVRGCIYMHFCCHLHLTAHALFVISYRDRTHCIWVSIFSVGDVAQMTQEDLDYVRSRWWRRRGRWRRRRKKKMKTV